MTRRAPRRRPPDRGGKAPHQRKRREAEIASRSTTRSGRSGLWSLIAAGCPLLAQVGLLSITLTQHNWSFVMLLAPGILMSATALIPALSRYREGRAAQTLPPPGSATADEAGEPNLLVAGESSLTQLCLSQETTAYQAKDGLWKFLVRAWRSEQASWAVPVGLQADPVAASPSAQAAPVETGRVHELMTSPRRPTEATSPTGPGKLTASSTFSLDILAQGPHALVAGTTGSGKSVFLQAWCAALALTHPPGRLNFVFLDFKGGSTFRLLHRLPHVVGFVSDLNLIHARRALRAIETELTRRESLIAEAKVGSVDELDKPPPRILIVVDEFHALRFALPDYTKHLVRIAAQGRSLGMNLILSTQNPLGQVSTDMKANINLNICLRVRDRMQSMEMLGQGLACELPAASPGLAVLNDSERTAVFRSARLQDPAGFVNHCAKAARFHLLDQPRPLFSPALPDRLPIPGPDRWMVRSGAVTVRDHSIKHLPALEIGLYDDGVLTHPCRLDLATGNLAVIGSPGRGQEALLAVITDQLAAWLPTTGLRHSCLTDHDYRELTGGDSRAASVATSDSSSRTTADGNPAGRTSATITTATDVGSSTGQARDTANLGLTGLGTATPDNPATDDWSVWLVEGADDLLDPLSSHPLRDRFLAALADRSRRVVFTVKDARRVRFPEHCANRILFPSGEPTVDVLAGIPAELLKEWEPDDVNVPGRAVLLTASRARTIQCFQKN